MNAQAFTLLARWGYATRGVVYLIIGAIALSSALNGGGKTPDSSHALTTLLEQPFGRIMLGAVAVGLVGHVLWRLAQALLNADDRKNDAKGLVARASQFASALAHIALAYGAVRMALGQGSSGGGESEKTAVAWLMEQPFGAIAVGLVGALVIAAGVVQIKRGIQRDYEDWIQLPGDKATMLRPVCTYGLVARGVVFLIVGGFLVYAGWTVSPDQAGSLADALDWVRGLPFGQILFGLVALGLFAFGAYSIIEGIYRRVGQPKMGALRQAIPVG